MTGFSSRPAGTWDAVVVGAGPAGAIAARGLAQRGHSVLLVERSRWPRDKVCGSCLNGLALSVLADVNLGHLVERCGGRRLGSVEFYAGGRNATLPLPAGMALSRRVLDDALVNEAVRAGAAFLPETSAAVGPIEGDQRQISLRSGTSCQSVSARVVLATAGLGADVVDPHEIPRATISESTRIGAGITIEGDSPDYRPGIVYMACGRQGYVGLVRVESGRLDVAAALDPAVIRASGGIGAAVAAILAEAGLTPPAGVAEAAWRGTPALTRTRTRLAAERLFLAGDSAGYVEPFTGEGIGWALASGHALVPLAQLAIRGWRPEYADQWEARYRALIQRRQGTCRSLRMLVRHPLLVRSGLALLGTVPRLATPILQRLNAGLAADGIPA
ncbi:MAG: NAD(P)/FAD-dependent oxidoreductase [Gemmatimonadales bacterium]